MDTDEIIIMRISSNEADDIFNELSNGLFTNLPISKNLLNKKIYICSYGSKKSIIGHVRISGIYHDKPYRILIDMGHFKDEFSYQIIKRVGKYNKNIYAIKVDDVTEFDLHLPLSFAGGVHDNFIEYINPDNPMYHLIKEWDKEFSLGHKLCENPINSGNLILKRYKVNSIKKSNS